MIFSKNYSLSTLFFHIHATQKLSVQNSYNVHIYLNHDCGTHRTRVLLWPYIYLLFIFFRSRLLSDTSSQFLPHYASWAWSLQLSIQNVVTHLIILPRVKDGFFSNFTVSIAPFIVRNVWLTQWLFWPFELHIMLYQIIFLIPFNSKINVLFFFFFWPSFVFSRFVQIIYFLLFTFLKPFQFFFLKKN